jgi:hypothetical protein
MIAAFASGASGPAGYNLTRGRKDKETAMAEEQEKTYSEDEIAARLAKDLPKWKYENGWIRRKYKTHSWKGTLMVINTPSAILPKLPGITRTLPHPTPGSRCAS